MPDKAPPPPRPPRGIGREPEPPSRGTVQNGEMPGAREDAFDLRDTPVPSPPPSEADLAGEKPTNGNAHKEHPTHPGVPLAPPGIVPESDVRTHSPAAAVPPREHGLSRLGELPGRTATDGSCRCRHSTVYVYWDPQRQINGRGGLGSARASLRIFNASRDLVRTVEVHLEKRGWYVRELPRPRAAGRAVDRARSARLLRAAGQSASRRRSRATSSRSSTPRCRSGTGCAAIRSPAGGRWPGSREARLRGGSGGSSRAGSSPPAGAAPGAAAARRAACPGAAPCRRRRATTRTAHEQGRPLHRAQRAPPLRAPPRASRVPGGGLALRGDHRDVPAAPRGVRPLRRRRDPVPHHHDAHAAPGRHAARRVAHLAVREAARSALRALRQGSPPDAHRRHFRAASLALSRAPLPFAKALPRSLQARPGPRLQATSRSRRPRDHHLRRDPRLLAADGPPGIDPRAGPGGGGALPDALRPRSPRDLAPRVRLRAGARQVSLLGEHPLLLRRLARARQRGPEAPAGRVRAHLHAERRRGVRPRSGKLDAGVERRVRISRRRQLPRVLPRHRLRPRLGLRASVHPGDRRPQERGHQVLPDHRQGEPRPQGAVRPGSRPAQGGHARRQLPLQPHQADRVLARRWRGPPPIVISPYDAELYGHWWYEGRCSSTSSGRPPTIRKCCRCLADRLPLHVPEQQLCQPPLVVGSGRVRGVWLDESND